jgi:glycosyltransferase involved in cell wall biosynthesis
VRRQEREAMQRYDRVLVSSVADQLALSEISPETTATVLPNGVDAAYFAAVPPEPEPGRIILTGAMSYQPNAEAAVEFCRDVFPAILVRNPEARLDIVGSSPGRAVRALAGERVVVTGFVEDLRPFFSHAAVAICPTRLGAGSQYKVLEAMAAGVPVVATRAAAEAHSLRDRVHLLVADGPQQTVEAVLEVLGDRQFALRLREAASAEIRARLGWDSIGDELDLIHSALVAAARAAPGSVTA